MMSVVGLCSMQTYHYPTPQHTHTHTHNNNQHHHKSFICTSVSRVNNPEKWDNSRRTMMSNTRPFSSAAAPKGPQPPHWPPFHGAPTSLLIPILGSTAIGMYQILPRSGRSIICTFLANLARIVSDKIFVEMWKISTKAVHEDHSQLRAMKLVLACQATDGKVCAIT